MPSLQMRNGEVTELPDIVVSDSGEMHDDVSRALVIEPGVTLSVRGKISGSVDVREGARLEAWDDVTGSVHVAPNAEAIFHAKTNGTLHVSAGGVATLTSTAVAFGSMHVDGTLVSYGRRGPNVSGDGVVDDRDGSV